MRRSLPLRLAFVVPALALLAAAAPQPLVTQPPAAAPPPPAVRPVTETHFGVTVTDPYRYFENPKDTGLAAYFKAQSAYTRRVLDALPGRAALGQRIAQLDNATESLSDVQPVGGTYFYQKRPAGANTTRLYARAISGGPERLVFDPDRFARSRNEHYTFDYYSPSPGGRYVALGISEGGSQKTVLHVIDARTGRLLPDVIERAIYISPSWRDDGRSFYYFRTPKPAPQPARERERHQGRRAAARARAQPRPRSRGVRLRRERPHPVRAGRRGGRRRSRRARAGRSPTSRTACRTRSRSMPRPRRASPARARRGARSRTTPTTSRSATAAGDTLYLSSHKGAPRHRILALDLRRGTLAARASPCRSRRT